MLRTVVVSMRGGTVSRCYRRSLQLAQVAADDFQARNVNFAIHLGDIVDGIQRSAGAKYGGVKGALASALEQAVAAFSRFSAGTTYHVLGNHCLYCYTRERLRERLGMTGPGDRCYYSFVPHPKLRMIVLDTFDVAVIGNLGHSAEYQEADALLDQHQVRCLPALVKILSSALRHAATGEPKGMGCVRLNGGCR